MGLDDLVVSGYRYNDVEFSAVSSNKDDEGLVLDGLGLRDFGLGGGEIHLSLKPSNRTANDPGVWYAVRCTVKDADKQTDNNIGTLAIKQLMPDYTELKSVVKKLHELDSSHLLDRIVSECLQLHAKEFGNGPHASSPKRKSQKIR